MDKKGISDSDSNKGTLTSSRLLMSLGVYSLDQENMRNMSC